MDRLSWGWRGGSASGGVVSIRLERALRRLEVLAAGPPSAGLTANGDESPLPDLTCILNPPASPEAIAEAELRLGAALPADYTWFLLHSNGAVLSLETGNDPASGCRAELLGTEALVREAEQMEYEHRAGCIPELVVFATVGAEGDRLAFETGRRNPSGGCAVLDARHGSRPEQWWVIARDFTSWLDDLLTEPAALASFGRCWDDHPSVPQPQLPLQPPESPARSNV